MEKNRFYALCQEAGVPTHMRKHFEGRRGSLAMHFECLEAALAPPADGS